MSEITETVENLVNPILAEHDFYLYDIEFVKESKSWYLRVYIDKKNGINIEDCALVSDELSEKLDSIEPDPIPQAYFLEVSSPGAERPLKKPSDFENAIGEYIHVSLYAPIDGNKIYEGTLKEDNDDDLVININMKGRFKDLSIPKKSIAKARLAIKF
ncbi:ribosome maturation factor RimP [Apilactobacillus timberlakei]|uniref:Ribosome maturation factor RimP n=1 Tax=Apilactobacillus timberlakei TaxID=2008380 RepID=A0ABY2YUM7_9LACO|nr:ribosome maturation factor RimP [Apilactobacillus timberlakei]TPR13831.1 ribosome maturation factor RimP [Apilactobacillus timberlakei]TPR15146.1 ribosome maturation factor RimP [Apilactobacillus timberlakei]TPR17038.1 ribosome maturation factor RimP [Apilactobacillus timberlakei]TPR17440.1 ribosome maturation factor RimP [Apilactobacillus timberlakei]TPR20031.1 ribosome maturation factor RimP [Apilactobacillus timberlakei]